MCSKLFVPGSRPELFAKALPGETDALSFDLEDAVAGDRKAEARAAVAVAVADFVAGEVITQAAKLIIVRTNAPDSPHFALDLAAIQPGMRH